MPTLVTWGEIVQASFQNVWFGFAEFLPKLIGALIVLVIGIIIALVLKKVVMQLSSWLRLDLLAEKLDLTGSLHRVGIELKVGTLLGWFVKWFVVVVALLAAVDILEWTEVTSFLKDVALYLPNVVISVLILLAGIMLGNFVRNIVHRAVKAAKLESAEFLSGVARWAILIFSFLAALVQLQVAADLVRTLFAGFVAALAIAIGLSFGLGGREHAAKFLDKLRKEISS